MNVRSLLAIASIGLLTLVACDADGGANVTVTGGDSAAIEQIAGDKNGVAQVIRRAHERGTLDDAMAIVLADSTMAAALADILRGDARFIAAVDPPVNQLSTSKQPTSTRSKSTGSTGSSTTTKKGDVLDQAERTAQKVNERLEQAERVKREAAEAKRRVEDIIGKKP